MEVITVTSQGQDASQFISNFSNSIKLSDNYQVGLLKIAHPPVMNVTERNNKIFLTEKDSGAIDFFEIPVGFYETTHDVARAIHDTLSNNSKEDDILLRTGGVRSSVITTANIRYGARNATIADNSKLILELLDKRSFFLTKPEYNELNILNLLDFRIGDFSSRSLMINNYDLESEDQIGFIYSSIVSNSLIDYRVSRLLDTVAIKSHKNGHCLFEVQNPVFHDVSAASFIDISFEIRDINGEMLKFHGDLPTILTLGIRKKPN